MIEERGDAAQIFDDVAGAANQARPFAQEFEAAGARGAIDVAGHRVNLAALFAGVFRGDESAALVARFHHDDHTAQAAYDAIAARKHAGHWLHFHARFANQRAGKSNTVREI